MRTLSFGFDTERPYGECANTPANKRLRHQQLSFIQRMNDVFDGERIPRTYFILGDYLEQSRKAVGKSVLRWTFPGSREYVDIQQHSYSHGIIEPLEGVQKEPMTSTEFITDVARAKLVIEDTLNVKTNGLRTPYGYEHDLSGHPTILRGLAELGINHVSSDLGNKSHLYGALTPERQPHRYADEPIIEIPSHGPQDVLFTTEKAKQVFNKPPVTKQEAMQQYIRLLNIAGQMPDERVSIALCLHPWAVMEYDNDLSMLTGIANEARRRGFELLNYRQLAKQTV